MGDRSQFWTGVLWSTCWVSHIRYGKYLYFWAKTNLVNSELFGMLNTGQAGEKLAQGWKKSSLTGSSMPISHLVVFTGACLKTNFIYLHDKVSALQTKSFAPGMENKRKR